MNSACLNEVGFLLIITFKGKEVIMEMEEIK